MQENKLFLVGLGGRIFNCTLRALANQGKLMRLNGVSASGQKDLQAIAAKIRHDSTHGKFPVKVDARGLGDGEESKGEGHIGYLLFQWKNSFWHAVPVFAQPDPSQLPLKELLIDVVIDASGKFLTREKASGFLQAGAKKVIMSAPAKDDTPLVIYGINDTDDKGLDIISRSSCTTTCVAPVVQALGDVLGVPRYILLNTAHAVTNSQSSLDANCENNFANGCGCMDNIVLTKTGATESLQKIFPGIEDTTGASLRAPVTDGSICCIDMQFDKLVETGITKENVLEILREYAKSHPHNLRVDNEHPTLTSTYLIGEGVGSIVLALDDNCIRVIGNTIRVFAGYDNEYGYSYLLALSALNCPLPPSSADAALALVPNVDTAAVSAA